MIRYTTPTITLTISNFVLPDNVEVYVTLKQGTTIVTRDNATYEQNDSSLTISLTLTQEETGGFKPSSPVQVQVNWIDSFGVRCATKIATIASFENLLDEVITYGD